MHFHGSPSCEREKHAGRSEQAKRSPSRRAAGKDMQRVQAAARQSMLAARSRGLLPTPGGQEGTAGLDPSCPVRWAMPGAGLPTARAACALLLAKPPALTPLSGCWEQPKPAAGDIAASSDCAGGGRCGGRRRGGGRRVPAARGLPARGARRLPQPGTLLQRPEQLPALLGSVARD